MEYIKAKTIITKNKKPDYWFGHDYNMNIYKGCNHGCIYCDSRSECYHIENFSQVRAKENALEIIRNQLRSKVNKGVVGSGAMSDPYNPYEKELHLTRNALELINAYGFGIGIATKSALITRDMDIIQDINKHSPVCLKLTITTADDNLSRIIEPNVNVSSKRFEALAALSDKGIYAGILLMPVLPFINDTEDNIISIIKMAHEAGAKFIYPYFGVTLRQNQRCYFYDKLDKHFPGIKEKYIKQFGNSYKCNSSRYRKLWSIFKENCDRYNMLYNMKDIISSYRSSVKQVQLSIFDYLT
ncbi:radical SAM protein [Vallitalea longa]|uniref:Radical SAM protein n=1 Tax=Vallitalea longa TaxID=2936439 RepID=A0A9W6DF17_9FIRM|nr:radical SAM protein [Vallitalea longa]GKX30105.1 radical SAM protein [Vallitalea longa]